MVNEDESVGLVRVQNLKLASWLRFNGEKVVRRETLKTGKIAYWFSCSPSIASFIETWEEGQHYIRDLSRFSNIVSYEIRLAVKQRRRDLVR